MQKLKNNLITVAVKKDIFINNMKENLQNNKKGVATLVEVAGVLALIVTVLMVAMPQARTAVSKIWKTVTDNANNFFNNNTIS